LGLPLGKSLPAMPRLATRSTASAPEFTRSMRDARALRHARCKHPTAPISEVAVESAASSPPTDVETSRAAAVVTPPPTAPNVERTRRRIGGGVRSCSVLRGLFAGVTCCTTVDTRASSPVLDIEPRRASARPTSLSYQTRTRAGRRHGSMVPDKSFTDWREERAETTYSLLPSLLERSDSLLQWEGLATVIHCAPA